MKNRYLILILVALFTIIISCNNAKENDANSITAHLNLEAKSDINLDYDISILQLPTNDSILLGRILKFQMLENRIYLNDRNAVYIFDKSWNLIKKIKKGAGPGELYGAGSFNIDKKRKELLIEDTGFYIKLYDLDGNFLKQYYPKIFFDDAIRIDDNRIALHSASSTKKKQDHLLYIYDTKTKQVIDKYINVDSLPMKSLSVLLFNNFTKYQDISLLCSPNSRTIYQYDSAGAKPYIKLDLGKLEAPKSYIDRFKRESFFMKAAYKDGYIGFTNYFYQFNSFSIAGMNYKDFNCGVILNKDKKNIRLSSTYDLFNFPKVKSLKMPVGANKNRLFFALDPADLFENNEEDSKTMTINIGNNKIKINEMDNPLIIIVNLH